MSDALRFSARPTLPLGSLPLVFIASTAGLLHDLGKLVLAYNLPYEYEQVLAHVDCDGVSLQTSEKEVFGSTHEEVGAYLLGLWGLPDEIVKSVAWHHHPSQCKTKSFGLLAAVHVADALKQTLSNRESIGPPSKLDVEFLQTVGKRGKVEFWMTLCADSLESGKSL